MSEGRSDAALSCFRAAVTVLIVGGRAWSLTPILRTPASLRTSYRTSSRQGGAGRERVCIFARGCASFPATGRACRTPLHRANPIPTVPGGSIEPDPVYALLFSRVVAGSGPRFF